LKKGADRPLTLTAATTTASSPDGLKKEYASHMPPIARIRNRTKGKIRPRKTNQEWFDDPHVLSSYGEFIMSIFYNITGRSENYSYYDLSSISARSIHQKVLASTPGHLEKQADRHSIPPFHCDVWQI
jgi:hypothetical protein